MRDDGLRDLERAWKESRHYADWLRWAREAARSGDRAPLALSRSARRKTGAEVRMGKLRRLLHQTREAGDGARGRRTWIEELIAQADHIASQSARAGRRALLELRRRGLSPEGLSEAFSEIPEFVALLGDVGHVRSRARAFGRSPTGVAERVRQTLVEQGLRSIEQRLATQTVVGCVRGRFRSSSRGRCVSCGGMEIHR